ncbi:hypothetical protein [Kineosporia babensis]|uniref:Uncharacterized protein n=1 Tax=Kineosporia babensis TaxID=499548 RepID=A0A9X1T0D9_9ACTN|nr:hypothetical protein [Kineosporia babensis]MCD5312643.1 hypothetical protein [Kineosporia babensis]
MVQTLPKGGLGFARLIEEDGQDLPRRLVWALFWLPLVSLAGLLAAALIFRPAFDKMLEEDFPVEWGQFALSLFISVLAGLCLRPALRERYYPLAALLLLGALAWFFLAGEEISWGQRVFGIATPEGFEGNHQAETNLHNFTTGIDPEALFRLLQLLISVVMIAVSLFGRLADLRPGSLWRLVAPPLGLVPLLLAMPGYRLYRLFVPGEVNFAVRLQEWAEFCQYAGLAVALAVVYFGLQPGAEPVGGSARHAARYRGDPDWRRLRTPAAIVLVITLIFAVMTRYSGITAGNAL